MYLMYVDESGDVGLINSPTKYFILCGLIFHELRWNVLFNDLLEFRRHLRLTKGLKLREEIHASHFIDRPGDLVRIKRNDRLDILKQCIDWVSHQPDLNLISIIVNKNNKHVDVFNVAWTTLLQRFENTMRNKNFSGPANPDDKGLVISDNTDGKKLIQIVRKMRRYNPVPNTRALYTGGYRNIPCDFIIEDPFFKDSAQSFFHQMLDVIVYMTRQLYEPNAYLRKKGGHKFYYRLEPVIVKKVTKNNTWGLVEI